MAVRVNHQRAAPFQHKSLHVGTPDFEHGEERMLSDSPP